MHIEITHTPPVIALPVGAAAFDEEVGVHLTEEVAGAVHLGEVVVVGPASAFASFLEELELVDLCVEEVFVEEELVEVLLALQRLLLEARFWMFPSWTTSGAATGERAAMSW